MPRKKEVPLQTLASLKRQRRSRRSLQLVVLLFVVFGVLLLAVIFFMKPEVKRSQIVAQRERRPISSIDTREESTIPGTTGEMGMDEKPVEGGTPEEEKPIVSKPPEPLMKVPSRELERVATKGVKELRKAEKISQILVDKGERVIQVTLIGNGKIGDYKSFKLENPPRLVIDIGNVEKEYPKSLIQVDHPLLKRIRLGRHPKKTRFVFDFAYPEVPHFQIQRAENRLIVSFGHME
jgi:hypothetical protein